MSDRVIVTLAIGQQLHPKTLVSFTHAAKRWDAKLEVIDEPLTPPQQGVHPWWQKAFVAREFKGQHVLLLDNDMLINANAPSPFTCCSRQQIGVVSARQSRFNQAHARARDKALRAWAAKLGVRPIRDEYHLNGGFWLFDADLSEPFWTRMRRVGASTNWCKRDLPEQAVASLLLHHEFRAQRFWMPHAYNVNHAQCVLRPELQGPQMRGYIYHFNGPGAKAERIHQTWWDHPGAVPPHRPCTDAILKRIPTDRWVAGAEVGVLKGQNAAALLWHRPMLFLYLVDRWSAASPSYVNSGDANAYTDDDRWAVILDECLTNLWFARDRVRIVQLPSAQAALAFKPGALDFVYIDGCHTMLAASADIAAWKGVPKSWIGGHDYGREAQWPQWGVTSAVQAHFETFELDDDGTWFANACVDAA